MGCGRRPALDGTIRQNRNREHTTEIKNMPEIEKDKIGVVSQDDIDQLLAQNENVFEDTDPPEARSEEPPEKIDLAEDVDAALREIPEESSALDEEDPVDDNHPSVEAETDSIDDADDSADQETPDRVILEDVPLEQTPKLRKGGAFAWKPGKRFWMVLVTIAAIGGVFIFLLGLFNQKSTRLPGPVVLTFPILPEAKPSDTPTLKESPRSFFMKGFIVPAPPKRKGIIFAATDIGLEFATAKAASVVKEHVPFFRSIIYEVLLNVLESDNTKIDPITLKLAVLRGLEGALPARSVKNVIVDTFKIYE